MKCCKWITSLIFLLAAVTPVAAAQQKQNIYASSANAGTQRTQKVEKGTPLAQVLRLIEDKYNVHILYNSGVVAGKTLTKPRELHFKRNIYDLLDELLPTFGFTYKKLTHRTLGIVPKQEVYLMNNTVQETISGTVTDGQSGDTLPGVNIRVKGTNTGTATDANGHYELSVESLQDTLVFSFVGYQTREVPINGRGEINIEMKSQIIIGEEMVVTALGQKQEQRTLSYSTEEINTEQVAEARDPNIINSLAGKVAGLKINKGGFGVGSPSRVLIRGNRSFNGNDGPLYVVDGVPVRGGIDNLSPSLIENINVLKGPNAAALYGSRAQNGAIIVTTKKGKAGEVKVSLNNNFMRRTPNILFNFQNEYGQGQNGQYDRRAYASWGAKMEGQMVQHWSPDPELASTQIPYSPQPHNVRNFFQAGYNESANMRASVGTEDYQFLFNYTYSDARGVVPNNTLKRHNVNMRLTSQLSKRLSLDSKLTYINTKINYQLGHGNNTGSTLYAYRIPRSISTAQASNYEYEDQEGNIHQNTWLPGFGRSFNPYWVANNIRLDAPKDRVIGLASLTYDFTNNLNLMVRGSYDESNSESRNKTHNGTGTTRKFGFFSFSKSTSSELNLDYLLSYRKKLNENWSINANQGGNIRQDRNIGISANTGEALVRPNFFTLSNTQLPAANYNPGASIDIWSLYGSANIGWKDAIFLNVTGRNDWSSTLPSDSRSFFYPSVGLSVVLSDLISTLPEALSSFKVRASWAKVGSSAPAFMTQRFANFSPGGENGFISLSNTLPATGLKPEETKSYEVGFDLALLDGRIGLSSTAYKSNTRNQLFSLALPVASGASSFFTNGGNVQNKGIEILLNTTPIQASDFNWNMDFSFSANRSEVVKIADERDILFLGGTGGGFSSFAVEEGEPFGQIYSKGFVRDDEGRVLIGSDGLPLVTGGQTVPIANPNPDWLGSLTSSFRYKNFSFNILFDYQQGGSFVSRTNALVYGQGDAKETLKGRDGGLVFGNNLFSDETAVLASDGSPNTKQIDAETFWSNMGGFLDPAGEAFVVDATNARLRELTLSYSLPQSILANLPFSNFRISLVGRNLFFIYRAADDVDPDILSGTSKSDQGVSDFPPPSVRSFGANVSIDF